MSDGALQELLEGMAARAAGKPVSATPAMIKETDNLHRTLDRDQWVFGPAGSKNIPIFAAAALGRFDLIARVCEVERTQGLFGLEHGAPGMYYSEVLAAKLLAYRELPASHPQRETVRGNVRAALAWDSLIALPVGRLRDRIQIADKEVEGSSPLLTDGITVGISGNRWTPKDRRESPEKPEKPEQGITSDDAHSIILAWALDWQPRATRAPRQVRGTMAGLLGVQNYSDSTPPERWGLTAAERSILRAVVHGDGEAARSVSEQFLWGTKPSRPAQPDPWRFRLRRTELGVESIFFGPGPNPNKPARAVTQVLTDGTWLGLQPSGSDRQPAAGYHVEIRASRIHAVSSQSKGDRFIPELGGDLRWDVSIVGQEISFHPGRIDPLDQPGEVPRPPRERIA